MAINKITEVQTIEFGSEITDSELQQISAGSFLKTLPEMVCVFVPEFPQLNSIQ